MFSFGCLYSRPIFPLLWWAVWRRWRWGIRRWGPGSIRGESFKVSWSRNILAVWSFIWAVMDEHDSVSGVYQPHWALLLPVDAGGGVFLQCLSCENNPINQSGDKWHSRRELITVFSQMWERGSSATDKVTSLLMFFSLIRPPAYVETRAAQCRAVHVEQRLTFWLRAFLHELKQFNGKSIFNMFHFSANTCKITWAILSTAFSALTHKDADY